MKLCPKCGYLSYFDSFFQDQMCNTCHNMKENDEFTQEEINRQLMMPRLKPEFGTIKWDVKA